ncbi:hypothetical protein LINPERHAP1_LOCUS31224 [Linum perenne]
MDVRKSLRREKRLKRPGGRAELCKFRYEKLPTFCFICGLIGHVERNCQIQFRNYGSEIERKWGPELRALPRSNKPKGGERWLVEDPPEASDTRRLGDGGQSQMKELPSRNFTAALPVNIQQLSANWGASRDDDNTNVDVELAGKSEAEEIEVGAEKKRRRGEGIETIDTMAMETEKLYASPTKKTTQGIQDPKNLASAGLFNRTCPQT